MKIRIPTLFMLAIAFSSIALAAPTPDPGNSGFTLNKSTLYDIAKTIYEGKELVVQGTEYAAGEKATVFLQLKNNLNDPILNASCYFDLFHPNKTKIISNGPMLYLAYSDGLYFYDYNLPINNTGVYMMSAECTYSQVIKHYYTLTAGGWNPFEAGSCGGELISINVSVGGAAQGAPVQLNNLMDWAYVYQASSAGGTKAVNTTFTWNATAASCKLNKTNTDYVNFYYMGESYNPLTMYFYAWNWDTSSWNSLGSLLTTGKASTTASTGIEDYFAGSLNKSAHIHEDGTVKIQIYVSAPATFSMWYDWLGLVASTNGTSIVDLKGSGEIHISPFCTAQGGSTVSSCETIAEQDVLEKEYYRISMTSSAPGETVFYKIFDENDNEVKTSDIATGKTAYVFKEYASRSGIFTVEGHCGNITSIALLKINSRMGEPTDAGFNISLGLKILGFLILLLLISAAMYKLRYIITYVIGIGILIYVFYLLFLGGVI